MTAEKNSWKSESRSVGVGRTPEIACGVKGHASAATAYVHVYKAKRLTADQTLGGMIRVDLIAELMGARMHIGSAFMPIGATGIAVTATGFDVDAWQVALSSNQPGLQADVRLSANRCCTGGGSPIVRVPQLWRPTAHREDQIGIINRAPVAPLELDSGIWRAVGVTNGTISIPEGERCIELRAIPTANPNATLTVPNGVTTTSILIPNGNNGWFTMSPRGALVGPADVSITTGHLVLELVR